MREHRIVVAGCGSMAGKWVEYTLERKDCTIVGLVDISQEASQRMAERFHLDCPQYTSVEVAIQDTKPDLVYDLTLPSTHCQISTRAMQMGCDVMGEKPMSDNVEQAKTLVRTAEETGRFYAIMQNRRYLPGIRDVRDFLDSNVLGKPGILCADFFLGAHFDGFRKIMDNPLLLDMAVHTFDMARFVINANAVSVYCHAFNPPGSWFKGNASTVCIFEMDNGCVFCYRGSWSSEGHPTAWECDWRIQCEQGTVLWDGNEKMSAEIVVVDDPPKFLNGSREVEIPRSYNARTEHDGCLDAMFDAYNRGKPAETVGRDNINSVMMALAAARSASEGRKVYLSEM